MHSHENYSSYSKKGKLHPVMLQLTDKEIDNYDKKRREDAGNAPKKDPRAEEKVQAEIQEIKDLQGLISVGHTYTFLRYAHLKEQLTEKTPGKIMKRRYAWH